LKMTPVDARWSPWAPLMVNAEDRPECRAVPACPKTRPNAPRPSSTWRLGIRRNLQDHNSRRRKNLPAPAASRAALPARLHLIKNRDLVSPVEPLRRDGGKVTAEIAILNRTAVALAADSAVTLGVRGQQKIYNSVDKLFHLVLDEPVGVMIFGGAEYMGVPIETVIKKFRSSIFSAPKRSLKDYATAFFDFLEKEISVPAELAEQHVGTILAEAFDEIRRQATSDFFQAATSQGGKTKRIQIHEFFPRRLLELVTERIESLKATTDCAAIKIDGEEEWCKTLFENVYKEFFRPEMPEELKQKFREFSHLLLQKDVYSRSAMGLVFAGFGQDEIFPKLQAFQSDGRVGGGVKRQETRYVDIRRTGEDGGARIEAFAQKEMVDRFLDGIDPDFEDYLRSAMSEALNDMGKDVLNSFVKTSAKNKKLISEKIAEAADKYLKEFSEKSLKRKETNFRQKILDMVNFMPKSDLANMAESLINLTSTKRRVSAESETVGGPIDVAVISKFDGFVWIKRKHYFEKELNPRYFVTQGRSSRATGGEK